jgi:hypothetical protein
MRWLAVLCAFAALAVAASAALAGGPARVRLADRSPAVVSGSGFHPQERVRVVVSSGSALLRKTVTAGARGAFVARWDRSLPTGCVGTEISAKGSAGSRAFFKAPPPSCAAPLQPVDR